MLPAGTDLMRFYLTTLLNYHNGGWTLHEFTSDLPQFFASKDGEQRYVMITSIDPALPKPERGNLMGRAAKE
jgi:hypothetical protein